MLYTITDMRKSQIDELKRLVIEGLDNVASPSELEVENVLESNFDESHTAFVTNLTPMHAYKSTRELFKPGIGRKIWEKLKSFLCKSLSEDDTKQIIVDAVIAGLTALMPGGGILLAAAILVAKYILKIGIQHLCE
jgi:hypothetical protein